MLGRCSSNKELSEKEFTVGHIVSYGVGRLPPGGSLVCSRNVAFRSSHGPLGRWQSVLDVDGVVQLLASALGLVHNAADGSVWNGKLVVVVRFCIRSFSREGCSLFGLPVRMFPGPSCFKCTLWEYGRRPDFSPVRGLSFY